MCPDRSSGHQQRPVDAHVLVGVDGSAGALRALEWAAVEARRRGVGLRLLACYSVPVTGDPGISGTFAIEAQAEALEAEYQEYLDRAVLHLRRRDPDLPVERQVALASATSALIDAAGSHDLIVIGSAGRSGRIIDALGSVATSVAHRSPVPVVVVPSVPSQGVSAMNRIVVGTDGSAAADSALQWAVREAELAHAALEIVHAWEYPYPTPEPEGSGPRAAMRQHALEELDRSTAAVKHRANRDGVKVQARLVEGPPAAVLLEASTGADLLVVGSRGRGGFASMLLGSVSRTVVQHALCPVAVIHPTE
jgi:nucleotide-binding universal stress UspA family protein